MFGLAALALAAVFAGPALADKRVALIIGNANYARINKLENPVNDAPDIAEALRKVGFEVIVRTDVDKAHFGSAFAEFARKVNGADAALFYYAGHGIQYNKQNFMLPVDIEVEDYESVEFEAVSIAKVMDVLERSKGVKIVILDACRDNPLEKRLTTASRSAGGASRGLARIDRTEGTLVAYATAPDKVAQDGTGRNSPFTESLIKRLEEPGLEIGTLFRRVTQDVFERTNGQQRPSVESSLLNDFYLNLTDSDSLVWGRIRDADDPKQFADFIQKYPASPIAREAKFRLDLFDRMRRDNEQRARADEDRVARERDDSVRAEAERSAMTRERDLRESLERERAALAAERLAFEKREAERRDTEKTASERRDADRLANEQRDTARREDDRKLMEKRQAELRDLERTLAARRETEKLASLKGDEARKEAERQASEKKADAERVALEKREADKLAAEKRSADRKAAEQLASDKRAEADKLAKELASLSPSQKTEREAARKEADRMAAEKKADADRLAREETESRRIAADLAAREKKAEQERVKLAALEVANVKRQQAETEKTRLAEVCKSEAVSLQSLSNAGGKAAIANFRKEAACPTIGLAIDKALKDIASAESRVCDNDRKALLKVGAKDIDGLRIAVGAMGCEGVRTDASARIAKLEAEGQKLEAACTSESEKVTQAKSASAQDALQKLGALQKGLTCDRLRPVVAEALKELGALAPKEAEIGSRSQILAAQTELKRLGCYTGSINGNLNNGTKAAVEKFFVKKDATAREARFSNEFVDELKREDAGLCPAPPANTPIARRPAREEEEEDEAPVVRRRPAKPEREVPVARRPVERPVAAKARPAPAPVAQARAAPVVAVRASAPAPVAAASRPHINVIGVGF